MSRRRRKAPVTLPKRLKAFGYCRVSTDEQVREGISLDLQQEKIEAYAVSRDLALIETIRDEGHSGKSLERPGLERLLKLVEGSDAEAVIVWKLDRLTRSTGDLLHLIEDVFKRSNTRFLSINEQIDTESAMGKFFLTIMGAMAQMEREVIAERTSAALQFKKEQGQKLGLVPYGFKRVNGEDVPDEIEMKVIRKMKRWKKKMSYEKVAEKLNEEGVSPRRKDARWHGSSVHHILKRPLRKGRKAENN